MAEISTNQKQEDKINIPKADSTDKIGVEEAADSQKQAGEEDTSLKAEVELIN